MTSEPVTADQGDRVLEVRAAGGAVAGTARLDPAIFGIEPNKAVLHQVVRAQLAAARSGTHNTKTRAEVSGGGRKPFKQKGTGRARQGSERAPHFVGGGIALGPKPRSYRERTPRKMIRLALRSALSDRCSQGRVLVVDRWPWDEPSTKGALEALSRLGLHGRALVVLDPSEGSDIVAYKSLRNVPGVQLIFAGELNAYDILCNDWIVFSAATLPGDNVVDLVALATELPAEPSDSPAERAVDAPAQLEPSPGMAGTVEPGEDAEAIDAVAGEDSSDE